MSKLELCFCSLNFKYFSIILTHCRHPSIIASIVTDIVCAVGKTGPLCEQTCEAWRWGVDCTEKCKCVHARECDAVTGECVCMAGYFGPTCKESELPSDSIVILMFIE